MVYPLSSFSYAGLALLIALTGCGLPFPEEALIVAAGMLSANDQLSPGIAFAACVLGVFAGDFLMYMAGYYGQHWIKRIVTRFSPLGLPNRLLRIRTAIDRHPLYLMLIAHLTIGLRPLAYFTIGAIRTPRVNFVIGELICACLVTSACFGPGYFIGDVVLTWFQTIGLGVTGFILVVFIVSIIGYFLSYLRKSHSDHPDMVPKSEIVREQLPRS